MIRTAIAATIALALTAPAPAADRPLDITGATDIGALLTSARDSFDIDNEDAILLLDSLEVRWTGDGRQVRTVHNLVLIRTSLGIRHWADLRVPFDSARQKLTVTALRTWRISDEAWIASGPTAQVETLPFALGRAPDYAHMRETMLLHDGVELPCVLETRYSVEDTEAFRDGIDGAWTLAREEPAVRSRLVLVSAVGSPLLVEASAGVPQAEVSTGDDGLERRAFTAGPVAALPHPGTAESAREVARVAWSSWRSWERLGEDLAARFATGLTLDDELRAALTEALADARTPADRASKIAELVAEATLYVAYEPSWWPQPRPAARTFATAYGHRVDRAALAAALFGESGFATNLAYIGRGDGPVATGIATVADLDGPWVWVSGAGLDALYDPAESTLRRSPADLRGRTVWRAGADERPESTSPGGNLALRLDLEWDGGAGAWSGRGVLAGSGSLSPFAHMAGLDDQAHAFLELVASTVLAGAEVSGHNLETFEPATVTAGFAFAVPAGDADDRDRLRLTLGDPAQASGARFCSIDTWEPSRTSAIHAAGPASVRLEVHLEPGDLEVLQSPFPRELANDAGSFTLTAERDDGGAITLVHELTLAAATYAPESWPQLRELLLAHRHERGRVILLQRPEDAEE